MQFGFGFDRHTRDLQCAEEKVHLCAPTVNQLNRQILSHI